MYRKPTLSILPLLLLVAALVLSGCSTLIQPVTQSGTAPTPVISVEQGGVENPDVYVDPAAFKAALLQAMAARDQEKLRMWMTEPFLTGTWRAAQASTSPAEALQWLYASELSADHPLALVQGVDLKGLMGGRDPLAIPSAEAGVVEAALVSGWGLDGRDEAVLFIARQPDNSLKWHGWMRIDGGFSGARFGGVQAFRSDALGFSVYLPTGYTIYENPDGSVSFSGPNVEGAGHPGNASMVVEPANGRTAEAAAEQLADETNELLGEYGHATLRTLTIDDTTVYIVAGVPGQDMHRQLFVVHNDRLYRMWFFPDAPVHSPVSYNQMENLYAMITNTLTFTE